MTSVELYIDGLRGSQREIAQYLHQLLAGELHLTARMRYKIPFYYRMSWICYLNPAKNGAVEFAFTRGSELSNTQGLLESKGRKQVQSMEFASVGGIPLAAVNEIIQEAILLDESTPYASKRRKRQ